MSDFIKLGIDTLPDTPELNEEAEEDSSQPGAPSQVDFVELSPEPEQPEQPEPEQPEQPEPEQPEPKQSEAEHRKAERAVAISIVADYGVTLNEMQEEDPSRFAAMLEPGVSPEHQYDSFIIQVSEAMNSAHPMKPEDARLATRQAMIDMGVDVAHVNERVSLYNRVSNGATLTMLQAYNGIKSFLDLSTPEDAPAYKRSLSELMEVQLKDMSEADSKLYSAVYPNESIEGKLSTAAYIKAQNLRVTSPAVDAGTSIGEALVYAGVSVAGGSVLSGINRIAPIALRNGIAMPTMSDKILTLAVADTLGSVGVDVARKNSETADISTLDIAVGAVGSLLGYHITPKGAMKIGDAKDSVINKFQVDTKELKKRISVVESQLKTPTQKAKLKKLKESLASEELSNRDIADALGGILDADYGKLKAIGVGDKRHPDMLATIMKKFGYKSGMFSDKAVRSQIATQYAINTARLSDNPAHFVDNILKNEKTFRGLNLGELVDWAKTVKRMNDKEAYMRYGATGLLTFIHLPSGIFSAPAISATFRNWLFSANKASVAKGIWKHIRGKGKAPKIVNEKDIMGSSERAIKAADKANK